jgi:hypothetical protein
MTSIFSAQHDSGSRARLGSSPRRFRTASAAGLVALVAPALVVAAAGEAHAAGPVRMGTTEGFAVLAGSAITNTGNSRVWGDVGGPPASSFTDAGALTVDGVNHADDAVAQTAKTDLITAYNDAAGATPASATPADTLGAGQTLAPGIYKSGSTILLNGALTLDGHGDQNAVFIFQAVSALTTGSASVVSLVNGAHACNVFWQVDTATLGTTSRFAGSLLANTSISLTTGATVEGRVLAQNGAVTMQANQITKPGCAGSGTTTSSTGTGTGTGTTSATAKGGSGSGQVRRVPKGAVDTGDGSTADGAFAIRRLFSADDTVHTAASLLLR